MSGRFKTKEEAQAFLRKVMGPPKRQLSGQEHDRLWLLIQMSTPVKVSNNQRTETEEYIIGEQRYDVTYGLSDNPIIEVYVNED